MYLQINITSQHNQGVKIHEYEADYVVLTWLKVIPFIRFNTHKSCTLLQELTLLFILLR